MSNAIITTCYGAVDVALSAAISFRVAYETDDPDISSAADDAVAALSSLSAMLAGKGEKAMDRERGRKVTIRPRAYTSHIAGLLYDWRFVPEAQMSILDGPDGE